MVVKNMKKRKLEDLSVDEFMNSGFDSDITDGEDEKSHSATAVKSKIEKQKGKKLKDSLYGLKTKDPEFYEFLKEEDKNLLDFSDDGDEDVGDDDGDEVGGTDDEESEDEDGSNDEAEENEDDELMKKLEAMDTDSDEDEEDADDGADKDLAKKGVHKLPKKLEVASHIDSSDDDSDDFDDGDDEEVDVSQKSSEKLRKKQNLVTTKMVKEWTSTLKKSPSLKALRELKKAFKAAVHQAGSEEGEINSYKVEDSKVFNAIVRACLQFVIPTLQKILQLPQQPEGSDKPVLPSMSSKWRKVASDVKAYLTSVIKLLSHLSDPAMVEVVMKHVNSLVPYCAVFPRLARIMLKKMVTLWGSAEETTRVLAFLCIMKLMRRLKDSMLELCLKRMYLTYVKNCKFTSPSTLPMINFMQRTMVEIFALDLNMAYQYGFVYIRQLAIHLRNAITVKKKENTQAVYNWQYIHCLHLWARVVSSLYPNEALQDLIYPLTETIIGTVKLLPTARYYPLRFHCVRTLNLISASTKTFIPVLPFLLEVFEQTDFNKKHRSISQRPFNFACILKFSKSQLAEKAFRDGIIDQLYELLLEHFHIHSHSLGFPELALPALLQMKDFLKKCKIANFCKQIKQIVEKVEESSKVITQRRNSAQFRLSDRNAVEAWERKSKEEGTPLSKFYTTWKKLRDREIQHEIAGKERHSTELEFPEIIRRKGPAKASVAERKEFSELFDTDSDESDDDTRFLLKEERPEPPKKKRKSSDGGSDDSDDYSDFDSDELEQLAGSGDDDDDDGIDDDRDENSDDGGPDDDDERPGDEDNNGDDSEEDSDVPDKEDVVKDFTFSSDED